MKGGQIDTLPLPGKATLKKPSLIRVKMKPHTNVTNVFECVNYRSFKKFCCNPYSSLKIM